MRTWRMSTEHRTAKVMACCKQATVMVGEMVRKGQTHNQFLIIRRKWMTQDSH